MVVHSSEVNNEKVLLQDVIHISSMTRELVKNFSGLGSPITQNHSNSDSKIPPLDLNAPQDIFTPLTHLHLPWKFRSFLLNRLDRLLKQLQREHTASYRRSCQTVLLHSPDLTLLPIIQDSYRIRFRNLQLPILTNYVSSIVDRFADELSLNHDSKRPFNTEFTPFLETYFQYNGYPSIAHRLILARESMMTPRQIEVWFQNHRNRAKKEGKIVKRLSASELPITRAMEVLQHKTSHTHQIEITTERLKAEIPQGVIKQTDIINLPPTSCIEASDSSSDPFRPTHAFPAKFSRKNINAFVREKLPPPNWMRRSAVSFAQPIKDVQKDIDLEEFISTFQLKLSFLERRRTASSSINSAIPDSPAWFSATVTIPPRGRHPSFVQTSFIPNQEEKPLPISFPSVFPVGSKDTSALHAFVSPRFDFGMPPNHLHLSHRWPSTGLGAVSPTSKFPSRVSSFSSDISSKSRISSSSSRTPSPEPTTPLQCLQAVLPSFSLELALNDFDFDFSIFGQPDMGFLNTPDTFDLSNKPSTLEPSLSSISDSSSNSNCFPVACL